MSTRKGIDVKKLILILCAVLLLASCVTIEYEGFRYTRLGNQELIDVTIHMEKSANGSMYFEGNLGKQFSETELEIIILQILEKLNYIR